MGYRWMPWDCQCCGGVQAWDRGWGGSPPTPLCSPGPASLPPRHSPWPPLVPEAQVSLPVFPHPPSTLSRWQWSGRTVVWQEVKLCTCGYAQRSSFHPFFHPFFLPSIHSSIHPFILPSILSSIHSFFHLSIHSSIHPLIVIHPFILPSIHSFSHPSINSSIHPFILSSIHSFHSMGCVDSAWGTAWKSPVMNPSGPPAQQG